MKNINNITHDFIYIALKTCGFIILTRPLCIAMESYCYKIVIQFYNYIFLNSIK